MSEESRKVRVSGRTDGRGFEMNVMPTGYSIEAEYHANSGPDRDATFAFVERLVELLESRSSNRLESSKP